RSDGLRHGKERRGTWRELYQSVAKRVHGRLECPVRPEFERRSGMSPVMNTTLFSFQDVDLAVAEAGSGPPVIFIHGYTNTHDLWHESMSSLSKEFRVVAYDIRGHGDSSSPATGYGIQDHTGDLLNIMDVLQIPAACLVGFAMGGG